MIKKRPDTLATRVVSALVLLPVVLGAIYFGQPLFALLIGAAAGVMAWEWTKIVTTGHMGPAGQVFIAFSVITVFATLQAGPVAGVLMAVVTVAAVTMFSLFFERRPTRWMALGAVYVTLPCVAIVSLRGYDEQGMWTLLWIMAVVWATDIGAYFAGRAIGGPKLAPRISPNKTWAGLAGGAFAAAVTGLVIGALLGSGSPVLLTILSGVLAVVAQLGDLFESGVKRRFDVKDSSHLIPGHGGVLDRVDGLLTSVLAVAALRMLGIGGMPL